jgi:hypothetical protein
MKISFQGIAAISFAICLFTQSGEARAQSNRDNGFSVPPYSYLKQGMSRADVLSRLDKYRGKNKCRVSSVKSKDDAEVLVVKACDKPEVHLAFSRDRLYWTSFITQSGLGRVIETLNRIASAYGEKGPLASKGFSATPLVAENDGYGVNNIPIPRNISRQAELSLVIAAPMYDLTLTLSSDGPNGDEISQFQQWAFAANAKSGACQ